jgi:uncharacterized protein GlcG (DUF336 family)
MADITLSEAERVLAGALDQAQETGALANIAVVDAGGNLKAFRRTDGLARKHRHRGQDDSHDRYPPTVSAVLVPVT